MADVEARREARRRKILQNSENRMNRLLGKPEASVEAPVQTSTSSSEVPDQAPLPGSTDVFSEGTTTTDQQTPQVEQTSDTAAGIAAAVQSNESQPSSESVRQRLHRAAPADARTEGEIESLARQSALAQSTSLPSKPVTSAKNGVADGHSKQQSAQSHVDPLKLLDLIRCGGCLLAAFLTRWALRFGLGLLFLECVMVPFLVLEGSLLYFQTTHMKDLKLPHSSSMMKYALVLSGVRQDVIVKYNTIMGYVSAVTEDFALFLFAFLICHAVIT